MSTDDYIVLVYKNLNAEINDTEFKQLNELSLSNPEYQYIREKIELTWDLTGNESIITNEQDAQNGFNKLLQKRDNLTDKSYTFANNLQVVKDNEELRSKKPEAIISKMKPLRYFISGIAACLLIISSIWWITSNQSQTYLGGEQGIMLTLQDQSIIELGPNSSLKVQSFKKNRTMTLDGQASFDVAKDPNKPFIVIAGNSRTEVLGTQFTIFQSKNLERTRIQVIEGRVQFSNLDQSSKEILIANESATQIINTLNRNTPLPNLGKVNKKVLTYSNTSLGDALLELLLIYGRDVNVENESLYECEFSGVIPTKSIDFILENIANQFDMKLVKSTNNWILKGGDCKN